MFTYITWLKSAAGLVISMSLTSAKALLVCFAAALSFSILEVKIVIGFLENIVVTSFHQSEPHRFDNLSFLFKVLFSLDLVIVL